METLFGERAIGSHGAESRWEFCHIQPPEPPKTFNNSAVPNPRIPMRPALRRACLFLRPAGRAAKALKIP